jgi:hypothetical protein
MEVVVLVQLNVAPAGEEVKEDAAMFVLSQAVTLVTGLTLTEGFTTMVNVWTAPLHPLSEGAAEKIPETGAPVLFVAEKDGIVPSPFAAEPIDGLLFTHPTVAVAGFTEKLTGVVGKPLQSVSPVTGLSTGVGSIVMSKLIAGPVHPLSVGVAVKFPVTGVLPAFVPAKAAMFPLAPAPTPMVASELVQLTVAPAGVLLKFMAVVLAALQIV